MSGLSEQEFRVKSDEALQAARQALLPLADAREFEVELQNGVLNLVFEEPTETKFVVSPNAPVRQIWVSAMARSYKLSWAPELGAFPTDHDDVDLHVARMLRFAPFTATYNVTGEPAITVPVMQSQKGLPVGIQLASALGNDALLLVLAQEMAQARVFALSPLLQNLMGAR